MLGAFLLRPGINVILTSEIKQELGTLA